MAEMPVTQDPVDTEANELFASLTSGADFAVTFPDLNQAAYQVPAATGALYAAISKLTNADITTGVIGGTGTFDALMQGYKAHLEGEFKANRIMGAEFTKAFIALTEGAMSNAVQFLLGRDAAYWQAITAQLQAQTAQVQLATARVQLEAAKAQFQQIRMEAHATRANYALTKLKLSTEGINYKVAAFNLEYMLPMQLKVVTEQHEVQRAQTLNVRSDTLPVEGVLGKQRELYGQQITSYKRDAEVKSGKLFVDAWITMKTIDEGLLPPTGFTNANLDTILTKIRDNNFSVTP